MVFQDLWEFAARGSWILRAKKRPKMTFFQVIKVNARQLSLNLIEMIFLEKSCFPVFLMFCTIILDLLLYYYFWIVFKCHDLHYKFLNIFLGKRPQNGSEMCFLKVLWQIQAWCVSYYLYKVTAAIRLESTLNKWGSFGEKSCFGCF